jgi:hypothetical protein
MEQPMNTKPEDISRLSRVRTLKAAIFPVAPPVASLPQSYAATLHEINSLPRGNRTRTIPAADLRQGFPKMSGAFSRNHLTSKGLARGGLKRPHCATACCAITTRLGFFSDFLPGTPVFVPPPMIQSEAE